MSAKDVLNTPAERWYEFNGIKADDNPVPLANRCAGMFVADPAVADQVESYAKANGGKVEVFYGFKFVTLAPPARVLEKLKLINRLEWFRKRRAEEALLRPPLRTF